jgi:hypothetical protein
MSSSLGIVQYHEEPFGPWDAQGTKSFPQLVFAECGILRQENNNDCGLAAIGNAFAFVNSFKDVPFLKRDMVPYHASPQRNTHDDYFATIPQSHRMALFWTNLLGEVSMKEDTIWAQEDQQLIWKMLRWEFIILLDRLALLSGVTLDERHRVFARMKEHYRLPYTLIPAGIKANVEFYPLACNDGGFCDGDTIRRTDSGGDLEMLASSAVASMPPLTVSGMHEQEDADSTDEEAQKKQARDVDSADEDDRKMPAVDTTGKHAEKKEEDNQNLAATENSKKRQGLSSNPTRDGQNKKA